MAVAMASTVEYTKAKLFLDEKLYNTLERAF